MLGFILTSAVNTSVIRNVKQQIAVSHVTDLKLVVERTPKVLCVINILQSVDSVEYTIGIINWLLYNHCLKICWSNQNVMIFQATTGIVRTGWIAVKTPSQILLKCRAVRCQTLQASTVMKVMSRIHIRAIWPSHQVSACNFQQEMVTLYFL